MRMSYDAFIILVGNPSWCAVFFLSNALPKDSNIRKAVLCADLTEGTVIGVIYTVFHSQSPLCNGSHSDHSDLQFSNQNAIFTFFYDYVSRFIQTVPSRNINRNYDCRAYLSTKESMCNLFHLSQFISRFKRSRKVY